MIHTAAQIAAIKGVSVEKVIEANFNNAFAVYGIRLQETVRLEEKDGTSDEEDLSNYDVNKPCEGKFLEYT